MRTERTLLRPPTDTDVDAVFAIYGDPASWEHLPSGLADRSATASMLALFQEGWREHGLDSWVVEDAETRELIGVAGTRRIEGFPLRNLGYRLAPAYWGRGLATEVSAAALDAAHRHDPTTPVTARVLTNNPASVRVLVKAGLQMMAELPRDDGLVRQIYSDRDLLPQDLVHLTSLG